MFLSDILCLIKSSDYGNVAESTIRDRIVLGIRDDATRKKLLQTRKLDLSKAIDICRSAGLTTRQLKAIASPVEVRALSQQPREQLRRSKSRLRCGQSLARIDQRSPSTDQRQTVDRYCQYCNRKHDPSREIVSEIRKIVQTMRYAKSLSRSMQIDDHRCRPTAAGGRVCCRSTTRTGR